MIIIFPIIALLLLVGRISYNAGRSDGHAEGWNERYFQEIEQLKARRNPLGQFKPRERL
jgi:hypothetical protein